MEGRNVFLWVFSLLLVGQLQTSYAQQEGGGYLHGTVYDAINDSPETLPGANIYWLGTDVGTISDINGEFEIDRVEGVSTLVVSFVGFVADTIAVTGKDGIKVILYPETMSQVEVNARREKIKLSLLNPINTQVITEQELFKAACCNLSESFETNPSIDVSFSDAVTGNRQIEMLGLSGRYVQISRENIPYVRGIASSYGMTFIPGTWISAINITKGVGPVTQGFESMTGEINVIQKRPEDSEKLYLNLYGNEGGRVEGNLIWTQKVGSKWATTSLFHTQQNHVRADRNDDGFLDNPLTMHFLGMNRWRYTNAKAGWEGQFGISALRFNTHAGQKDFSHDQEDPTDAYGIDIHTSRVEFFGKMGKIFAGKPFKSFGMQVSASYQVQDSRYGLRNYDAEQQGYYANFIYQSIIGNSFHKFKTGASYQADVYDETFVVTDYNRVEQVPGAFFEYTFDYKERVMIIGGVRADYNSIFGVFITPRIHSRFLLAENTSLRLSAGRGQRTANLVADNVGYLASSRAFDFRGGGNNSAFGFQPEVSWNYGINLTHKYSLRYRDGSISFDLYRTDFQNQVVTDIDEDPNKVVFYNLDGRSYSNSFQVEVNQEVIRNLEVRAAYRWLDVKTDFISGLRQKPFTAQHRWFVNVAYETKRQWVFDATLQWQGSKRIADTQANPQDFRLETSSPSYFLLAAQITKTWGDEKWAVYVGMENITNFRQQSPILSADQPFGPNFDASMVWGPVFGRMTYAGLRFKIK